MTHRILLNFALAGALCCAAGSAVGQDSGALIDALVRKGILTHQEAEEIRADLIRESNVVPAKAVAGGKTTDRFSIGGRIQVQNAQLGTDVANAPDPASTNHTFLRRVYLSTKANLGADWSLVMTYDFAAGSFDDAIIRWQRASHAVDIGLRKVNNAFEERSSSGSIKALERSAPTRYFVEANNGRRLGAGSYRVGVFYEGQTGNVFYGAAITNPERTENFSSAASAGDLSNNNFAYWGNVGITGKLADGTYRFGVAAALLPDQGGFGANGRGQGFDLNLYTAHADVTVGKFNLFAEYFYADIDRGASAIRDAAPTGYFIQPSYMVTEKIELVARYGHIDSDGRGISLSDGIRSAPSGGTMNTLDEYYLGGAYFFLGDDLKVQLGYVRGQTKDTVAGAPAKATTQGLRSQIQLQF